MGKDILIINGDEVGTLKINSGDKFWVYGAFEENAQFQKHRALFDRLQSVNDQKNKDDIDPEVEGALNDELTNILKEINQLTICTKNREGRVIDISNADFKILSGDFKYNHFKVTAKIKKKNILIINGDEVGTLELKNGDTFGVYGAFKENGLFYKHRSLFDRLQSVEDQKDKDDVDPDIEDKLIDEFMDILDEINQLTIHEKFSDGRVLDISNTDFKILSGIYEYKHFRASSINENISE